MRSRAVLILFSITCMLGCRFSEEKKVISSQKQINRAFLDLNWDKFGVGYNLSTHLYDYSEKGNYSSNENLEFPAIPPGQFELKVQFDQPIELVMPIVTATLFSGKGSQGGVRLLTSAPKYNSSLRELSFNIFNLRDEIDPRSQSVFYIEIELPEAVGLKKLFISGKTPPSEIKIDQVQFNSSDFLKRVEELSLGNIDAIEDGYRLVHITKLMNKGSGALRLRINKKIPGSIFVEEHHHSFDEQVDLTYLECNPKTTREVVRIPISDGLIFIPIIDDEDSKLLSKFIDKDSGDRFEIELKSNSVVEFGLFASGSTIDQLINGNFQFQKYELVPAKYDCRAKCDQFKLGSGISYKKGCYLSLKHCNSPKPPTFPGDCSWLETKIEKCSRCEKTPSLECDECYIESQLYNQENQFPMYERCQNWSVDFKIKDVKRGVETRGVSIDTNGTHQVELQSKGAKVPWATRSVNVFSGVEYMIVPGGSSE